MLRSRWMHPVRMPLEARESAKARSAWAPEGRARRVGVRFPGGRVSQWRSNCRGRSWEGPRQPGTRHQA